MVTTKLLENLEDQVINGRKHGESECAEEGERLLIFNSLHSSNAIYRTLLFPAM